MDAGEQKYLLWGIVPVTFDETGLWDVAIEQVLLHRLVEAATMFLLEVNLGIERLFDNRVEMRVPSPRVEDALVYRAFRPLIYGGAALNTE